MIYGTIERWMKDHIDDYISSDGVGINCTLLAQDAANTFDIYEGTGSDYTIPEWVYDMAVKVEDWYLDGGDEDEDWDDEDENWEFHDE
jgi:hypothetical protein